MRKKKTEKKENKSESHTPGPWYVGQYCKSEVESSRLSLVCECGFGPQAEADARLIAAAPELLDAAKAFLDRYVAMVNSGDCGNWNPEEEDFVIAMRAAIQKAESKSSET